MSPYTLPPYPLKLEYVTLLDGTRFTNATYVHNGTHACARFGGHVHRSTAEQELETSRRRAAQVKYAEGSP